MSMTDDAFDFVVIGAGPGGRKGGQAAWFGKRVAVVERSDPAGVAASSAGAS
jgi:pyruvate/2-oxoglutarate dehydrogenase complex dihydrolipoamide dehydrogenase (E3) component